MDPGRRTLVKGTCEKIGAHAIARTMWSWLRLGLGAAILVVLVGRLGAGPFLDGLRLTNTWALGAAVTITAATTLCCAWRWGVVSDGLRVHLPFGTAVAAYYRSQFLNATLPGGVLGDVHRAVRHGEDSGEMGRSLRSVAWERSLGQGVQILLTVGILLAIPSPVRSAALVLVAAGVAAAVGIVLVTRPLSRDLCSILRSWRAGLVIVLSSALAAIGHVTIFLVAARVAGATASPGRILPLALLVLLASAVPANIAGWGPREGMAAWAFGSAGLTAGQGVTTAVVYGVMVLVSTLPGAAVLFALRRRANAQSLPLSSSPRIVEDAVHG
jgi:uncharacterized membrane protein YbhN (UPF0104 family)